MAQGIDRTHQSRQAALLKVLPDKLSLRVARLSPCTSPTARRTIHTEAPSSTPLIQSISSIVGNRARYEPDAAAYRLFQTARFGLYS